MSWDAAVYGLMCDLFFCFGKNGGVLLSLCISLSLILTPFLGRHFDDHDVLSVFPIFGTFVVVMDFTHENPPVGQKKKRKRAEEDREVSSQGSSAAHPSSKEGISGYMLFYRGTNCNDDDDFHRLCGDYVMCPHMCRRRRRVPPFVFFGLLLENFELIKKSQPPGTSERDAIVEVAAQWVGISNEEKLAWKFRAEELNSPAAAAASESDQARGGAKKKGGKKTEIVARNPIDVTV
jgi:hypothetical protein